MFLFIHIEDSSNSSAISETRLINLLQFLLKNLKHNTPKDDNQTHNITCSACGTFPVRGDRYKCLQCDQCDLCASCFERRRESKQHKSGHLFVYLRIPNELFGNPVTNNDLTIEKLKEFYAHENHESVNCDGCMVTHFTGLRFKCDTCPNYDLCHKCARKGVVTKNHKSTHPLILTSRRVIVEIPLDDIEMGEKLGSGAFGKTLRYIDMSYTYICF